MEELVRTLLTGAASGFFLAVLIIPIALTFDRLVVWADTLLGGRHFRAARAIAAALTNDPDGWRLERGNLRHAGLDVELQLGGGNYIFHVMTSTGKWDPTWFDKRLIVDALNARTRRQIESRALQVT